MPFAPLRFRNRFSRMAALMAVFAVLLRCAIAPGVMPDPLAAADGVFKLVICTGAGIKVMHGGAHDGPSPVEQRGDDAVCPFAAFGHVAIPAGAVPLAVADFGRAVSAPPQVSFAAGGWTHTLGARAPPIA